MTKTFTLKLELENDALQSADDVGRLLQYLGWKFQEGSVQFDSNIYTNLMDGNGNTAGYWKVEYEN